MAKKKKSSSFWKRLLFWRKSDRAETELEEHSVRESRGYTWELKDLREKVDRFFLTRKKAAGLVFESADLKLTKNNRHLFRLEGKEKSGREYSLVLATGNYLTEQNGKVTGVIFLTEAELNRLLTFDQKSLKGILSGIREPKWEEESWAVLQEDPELKKSSDSWKEILSWEPIWSQQVIINLRPNVLAVLLVFLGKEFEEFFHKNSAERVREMVSKELYFLNVSGNKNSPHSENVSLYEFDLAKKELESVLVRIRSKREK
ncbi:hypothetical protein LEP1GSC047_0692 [Leptospira inadai serovar Lyme str. 10]|uniref:Uncharacterized protein n=2 Tax=Leptospira inadai serovar Lyme TaxID=293084 RepID=V6HBQ4_9LEPT|nr:hypothetical protein [Leptospira inadai]EQA37141.1 hypothetical protein LEP1GSC047_0692 [Leptospira inadai serovar Lyme str. 10]PNV76565.1 hypothetical protein BES34_002985 [Leptospira inadai serovar Lyme]